MSTLVTYGVQDDHADPAGPWVLLELESPAGDGAGQLLGPNDARELADRLLRAATRADRGEAGELRRKVGSTP